MGKNKKLQSLLNGITGEGETKLGRETQPLEKETVEALGVSPELEEAINKAREANGVGRPKKGQETGCKKGQTRATFIVDKELLRKLKYVSLMEGKTIKDEIEKALVLIVSEWEKKNGEIQLPKLKED